MRNYGFSCMEYIAVVKKKVTDYGVGDYCSCQPQMIRVKVYFLKVSSKLFPGMIWLALSSVTT